MNKYLLYIVALLVFSKVGGQTLTFENSLLPMIQANPKQVFVTENGYAVAAKYNINSEHIMLFYDLNGVLIESKYFGFPNASETYGEVKRTADEGYILVGSTFGGDLDNPNGESSALIKLDKYGNMIWRKTYAFWRPFDTLVFERGQTVAETEDGGFVMVSNYRYDNSLIRRVDLYGNELWHYMYGENSAYGEVPKCILRTSQNEYIIGGRRESLSIGDNLPLIFKIDGFGNPPIWEFVIDTLAVFNNSQGDIWELVEKPDGTFIGKSADGGDAIWLNFQADGSVIAQKKGLWGVYLQPLPNGDWVSVNKNRPFFYYDSDFNLIWQKEYGTDTYLRDVALAQDGGFILTGTKGDNLLLLKTDCQGNLLNPVVCYPLGAGVIAPSISFTAYTQDGALHLSLPDALIGKEASLTLTDMMGRVVEQHLFRGAAIVEIPLTAPISTGIYQLNIFQQNESCPQTYKIFMYE